VRRLAVIWVMPLIMVSGYVGLAITSESTHTAKAWMAIGCGFVIVIWFLVLTLASTAGLGRAVALGDPPRLRAICDRALASRRAAGDRAPFVVYRAFAAELEGDFAGALRELEALPPVVGRPPWALRAATIRVGALVETGQVAAARAVLEREVTPIAAREGPVGEALASLAAARVAWGEGALDQARVRLERLRRELRAGDAVRAMALAYAARCAAATGDPLAARLAAEARALAPGTWMAASTSTDGVDVQPQRQG
jgi:hypothetical protein